MKITNYNSFKNGFSFDIDVLNSMTKYPSIPTFHEMKEGRIIEKLTYDLPNSSNWFNCSPDFKDLFVTEKIDGTNARIVLFRDKVIIGSREEFLYASGDTLFNNAMGIVDTLKDTVESIYNYRNDIFDFIEYSMGGNKLLYVTFYGEVYGGKIGKNAKNYVGYDSRKVNTDFRLFDIASMTEDLYQTVSTYTPENLSSWRENGGQKFFLVDDSIFQFMNSIMSLSAVPFIKKLNSEDMPVYREDVYNWLKEVSEKTRASIDGIVYGPSEGVVIRNKNRTFIAKIRHEDYSRIFNKKH